MLKLYSPTTDALLAALTVTTVEWLQHTPVPTLPAEWVHRIQVSRVLSPALTTCATSKEGRRGGQSLMSG